VCWRHLILGQRGAVWPPIDPDANSNCPRLSCRIALSGLRELRGLLGGFGHLYGAGLGNAAQRSPIKLWCRDCQHLFGVMRVSGREWPHPHAFGSFAAGAKPAPARPVTGCTGDRQKGLPLPTAQQFREIAGSHGALMAGCGSSLGAHGLLLASAAWPASACSRPDRRLPAGVPSRRSVIPCLAQASQTNMG